VAEPGVVTRGARALRAELRKVCTLPLLALFLVAVAVLWQDLGRTISFASAQTPVAVAVSVDDARELQRACTPDPAAEACELAHDTAAMNRWFAPNARALGAIAASLDTLPGLLTFVSRQLGSGLGALLLAAFVGLHVSGEHANRTIEGSVQRTGRRGFWAAKVGGTVVVAGVAVVAATLVLFVLRPTFVEPVQIPAGSGGLDALDGPMRDLPADATWSSWAAATGTLAVALGLVALVGSAFAAVACLVRSSIGTAVLLGGVVLALFVLAGVAGLDAAAGHRFVAEVLGLQDGRYGVVDARLLVVGGRPSSIHEHVVAPATEVGWVVAWLCVWASVLVGGRWTFLRRRRL
jgi:hypothetical protein